MMNKPYALIAISIVGLCLSPYLTMALNYALSFLTSAVLMLAMAKAVTSKVIPSVKKAMYEHEIFNAEFKLKRMTIPRYLPLTGFALELRPSLKVRPIRTRSESLKSVQAKMPPVIFSTENNSNPLNRFKPCHPLNSKS